MLYNLKIALRNIQRNGIYSVINIGGLAIGMATAMLIMLWVHHQWSYDRFHSKIGRLYGVWVQNEYFGSWDGNPRILGPTLAAEHADIVNQTRLDIRSQLMTLGDKKLNLQTALADPGFLEMFDFLLLQGDIRTALNDPHSIILTENTAKRLFGDEDPMGKTIITLTRFPATVTGVMADLPTNTQFKFDVVRPYLSLKETGGYDERWSNYSTNTYVEIQSHANEADVNNAIKGIISQHSNGNDPTEVFLYPFSKLHLYSKVENGKSAGGLIETVRLFGLIALFILFIACVNFMNLSTARSIRRSCETGVRKVFGARRGRLVRQYLGESLLTTFIAAMFAVVLVILFLPLFNIQVGEQLSLDLENPGWWLALLVFILFTGVLAGSYPAFYLSSFLPVKVLKGIFKRSESFVTPRKALIVIQFTITVVLMISTITIHRQVRYAQDRNSGYDKDQLICVELTEQMDRNHALIRKELLDSGMALSITRATSPMTETRSSSWGLDWKGKNPDGQTVFNLFYVDADWSGTTGVTIIKGRDIDPITYLTDSTAVLLNETAVQVMGFDDPIGQIVREGGKDWHVVGVVKDFVMESPYDPVRPMLVGGPAGWFTAIHIKLNGANRMADNLEQIAQVFKTYNPEFPFEYKFVDEIYAQKYVAEQRIETLITLFAVLAVFISCLGLFGLSAYMAENRRKEIGVRKVLGASVRDITSLLSCEFLVLVLVSLFIAIPIAWLVMNKWLTGYSYRTDIPWWLFAVVALLTLGIALFTVSWQAIKAARTNPVNSIKAE